MARDGFLADAGRAALALVPAVPQAGVAYALAFDTDHWPGPGPEALALLGPAERARAARFRFERDRATYVLAHAAWRMLLARCLRVAAAQVPLAFAPSGQPRLAGTGWATSLSHSRTRVLLAAARAACLGVDIECAPARAGLAALAPDICTAAEHAQVQALPEGDREPALLRLWTRKEALLKAAGLGLRQAPSGFAAPAGSPVRLPGDAAGPACVVRDLPQASGWLGAWAAPVGVDRLAMAVAMSRKCDGILK